MSTYPPEQFPAVQVMIYLIGPYFVGPNFRPAPFSSTLIFVAFLKVYNRQLKENI